jgi:hypothetical protein
MNFDVSNVFGEDEKVQVRIEDDGRQGLLVSFDALKAGKHKISVQHHGKELVGSPFKIDVPPEAFSKR